MTARSQNRRTVATGEPPTTHDPRWLAVQARDSRADGRFVFAVTSTGIYCRPACPARRPRRDRVRLFPTPDAAEAAGFRPCRRCQPRRASFAHPDHALVARALEQLATGMNGAASPGRMARALGVEPRRLRTAFRRVLGVTPRAYLNGVRAERFRHLVRRERSVTAAMYEAGFGSSSRLYEQSSQRLGMTPSAYRKGGEGVEISYAVEPTAAGHLMVAATALGVCAVRLGPSEAGVVRSLRVEYPRARVRPDPELRGIARAIARHVTRGSPVPDLTLDVQATAFQARVWSALKRIPRGEVRTYAEIARAIGRPTAVRAVANACAANPVALVVPCHRVVRGDGGPGGYRWGVERKRALLALERDEPAGEARRDAR